MSEEEIKVNAEEIPEDAELENEDVMEGDDDEPETEIRDTDIVFDCPHCGHNLAIDYRGAGLQITCVNCGENVLVPIPDGMKIDDLDIEPGEILKQLFAARRHMKDAELRIAQLQDDLEKMTIRRDALQAMLEFTKVKIDEVKGFCSKQADLEQKMSILLDRMASDLDVDMADEAVLADDEGGEDGTPST